MFPNLKIITLALVCGLALSACTSTSGGLKAGDYTSATGVNTAAGTYAAPPLISGMYD
ncbi:MAG: hypothetical protein J0L97_01025 [Alphaproteobacteria bacterium]|nr:hypothetical protein [Alphaproteobacteria bacterium]